MSRRQASLEAEALLAGREPSPWIFTTENGTLFDQRNVSRLFRQIVQQARLPRFRCYDLRHTFASHLLELGAPLPYVAAQMGHAKPTTTLQFYAHYIPRGDKSIIGLLARARSTAQAQQNAPAVA